MDVLLRRGAPVVLLVLVLGGCAPTASSSVTDAPTTGSGITAEQADALVGSYAIEYRTTESDRDPITDETVVRQVEVTGTCTASDCDLAFATEVKGSDDSIQVITTHLGFDGAVYHGTQTSDAPCDGLTTLKTVEGGIVYTSETTVTPTSTLTKDGTLVVNSFEVVTIDHNEVTEEGIQAGCSRINLVGPNPYASTSTSVGTGTRKN